MRLHSSSANFSRLGFLRPRKRLLSSAASHRPVSFRPSFRRSGRFNSHSNLKPLGSRGRKHGFCDWNTSVKVLAMDDDSVGVSSLDDFMGNEGIAEYGFSSSDGEDSDGEVILQPITDIDLPTKREQFRHDDALTVTAHRFAMLGRTRKKRRVKYGNLNNMGLMIFLTLLLLLVDWCAWRIVRLPLSPFYLMRPFSISAVLVSCTGYICVPLLRSMKVHSIFKKEGPVRHPLKKVTPTMGGLFLVPIGVIVAEVIVDFSSVEVSGAAAATLAFAAIGLVNDFLSLVKNENNGLSAWIRICLEVAVGMLFSFWFFTANVSSPYSMKWVVPLPAPLGLVYLGQWYLVLTSFCFVSMSNGINLTAGLDGLAGGTAALAFIGMSIAVLPICSDLSIFGASMAGACVGFLLHNRYKASIFMGDTGALALGGALAAMAACTGMFFPLFISSGILLLEALSVIVQAIFFLILLLLHLGCTNSPCVVYYMETWHSGVKIKYDAGKKLKDKQAKSLVEVSFFRTTKYLMGSGRRFFQMAPFHHHLELCGFNEPIIVAGAYVISSVLALCAGYIGLISA